MREIKFRAWNLKDFDYIDISDWISEYESRVLQENPVTQFTWLLDKNWKQIFEWDIIKVSIWTKANPKFFNKEISYFEEYGIYAMKWQENWRKQDETIPFWKSWSSTTYSPYLLTKYWTSKLEIIWNIYENPELIK